MKVKNFKLDKLTTQELHDTGYAIFGKGEDTYCAVELDGEVMVFKQFEQWAGMQENCPTTIIEDMEVDE